MIRVRGKAALFLGACALVCACVCAEETLPEQNLLANPGFEELSGDQPARWAVFIEPMEGAFGRIDGDAYSGKCAVMLHTPMPYARDPANNWSQNIIGAYGGMRLRASGYIKVRDAQEAALWVQCWRRQPLTVIASASSSTTQPVYGARDWEQVAFTLDVPRGTDFITVRCVLRGPGTAWFDDITLGVEKEAETPKEKAAAADAQQDEESKKTEDAQKSPAEDSVTAQAPESPKTQEAAAAAPEASAAIAAVDRMDDELARLRQANIALAEALDQMRAAHDMMLLQLTGVQQQLQELRGDAAHTFAPAPAAPPVRERRHAPPLVPLGEDWRKYR